MAVLQICITVHILSMVCDMEECKTKLFWKIQIIFYLHLLNFSYWDFYSFFGLPSMRSFSPYCLFHFLSVFFIIRIYSNRTSSAQTILLPFSIQDIRLRSRTILQTLLEVSQHFLANAFVLVAIAGSQARFLALSVLLLVPLVRREALQGKCYVQHLLQSLRIRKRGNEKTWLKSTE